MPFAVRSSGCQDTRNRMSEHNPTDKPYTEEADVRCTESMRLPFVPYIINIEVMIEGGKGTVTAILYFIFQMVRLFVCRAVSGSQP